MKAIFGAVILLLLMGLFPSCNSNATNQKSEYFNFENNYFQYSGRTFKSDTGVHLISAASTVKAIVSGDSCIIDVVNLKPEVNQYISIELNNVYLGRFFVSNDFIKIPLMPNSVENKLLIYKATEAVNGPLLFKGLATGTLFDISESSKAHIEFIGNSITCGMGADVQEVPCGEGQWTDQHNAYFSYASKIARDLEVNFTLSCVSGMGIYRNWNDEDQPVIPNVYTNLSLTEDSIVRYEWKRSPEIISIALGTNDFSNGDGEKDRTAFDENTFISSYTAFVRGLIQNHPSAKILLLNSPMLDENSRVKLNQYLLEVKSNFPDNPITVFQFQPMSPSGCTYHPDIADHEVMATQLKPIFSQLLKQ